MRWRHVTYIVDNVVSDVLDKRFCQLRKEGCFENNKFPDRNLNLEYHTFFSVIEHQKGRWHNFYISGSEITVILKYWVYPCQFRSRIRTTARCFAHWTASKANLHWKPFLLFVERCQNQIDISPSASRLGMIWCWCRHNVPLSDIAVNEINYFISTAILADIRCDRPHFFFIFIFTDINSNFNCFIKWQKLHVNITCGLGKGSNEIIQNLIVL